MKGSPYFFFFKFTRGEKYNYLDSNDCFS
jgi:hypothetical protein